MSAALNSRPFLLTNPAYGGTLAAARCLGERGVPVTMAGHHLLAPARWSRYVTQWVKAPSAFEGDRFLDWLLEFGRRQPGHVLYPSSDELAWLIAYHAAELEPYFRLYQAPARAISGVLDKKALSQACSTLSTPTPASAFPDDEEQALAQAAELGYPILIKHRAHVFLSGGHKGSVVDGADALRAVYRALVNNTILHPTLSGAVPGVEQPVLQEYRPHASETIYSLAGFVGRSAGEVAARASQKILQRPRRLGIGLCFEEKPVHPELLDQVVRLCREVGYFGVFEAEFVPHAGQMQLIDFNPRFYGQMGFEIRRQLPLAYLVWLCAHGEHDAFHGELKRSQQWQEGRGYVYSHRFFLKMLIPLRYMFGRMTADEARRWRIWLDEHAASALAFDAAESADDFWPGIISALNEVYLALRHPRSFVQRTLLDR